MGLQKRLRSAEKNNYWRERGEYLSGKKIGNGMQLAQRRLQMERKVNALRSTGMTRTEALDKLNASLIEVVKKTIKRSRKKAEAA